MTPASGRILRWSLITAVIVVLAGAAVLLMRHVRGDSEQAAALARLETQNRDLRARAGQLTDEVADLRRQLGMPPPAASGGEGPESRRQLREAAEARLEAVRLAGQLRDSLAAAHGTISSLQGRLQELEAAVEKLSADNKRLTGSEDDLKERLAGTNRIIEAMQAELKGRGDRAAQLDIANRALRDENKKLSDKNLQVAQANREIEEINRRRETYLNNLLRRYRDLTDQFRVQAARADNSRDAASGRGVDMSRIQNVVSMAEEDLRQLNALNAQAQRLLRKMRGN